MATRPNEVDDRAGTTVLDTKIPDRVAGSTPERAPPPRAGPKPGPPPEAPAPPPAELPETDRAGPVPLREFLIDPNAPLADLDTPSAKAYVAQDRRDPDRELFALVCTPGLPPRTQAMATMKGKRSRGLLPLVDWDVVDWPPLSQRCTAVIYERPLGGRLIDALPGDRARLREFVTPQRLIQPLVAGLQVLDNFRLSHRSIRPGNLYFMDADHRNPVIGDFVTTPPGFDQPIVFETIERGMASPGGRGDGDVDNDIYALGVTLVYLILIDDPVAELDEEDLFRGKIERGSYATLCSKGRIPMHLLEPLRGMLGDDPRERWTLADLEAWLSGNRLKAIKRKPIPKADVPLTFGDVDYHSARTLAHAFSRKAREGAKLIRRGSLEQWIRHYLNEPTKADAVAAAVEAARIHEKGPFGSDAYLVAKIGIILDPAAPIRFKSFRAMPEAIGSAMATEFLQRGNAQDTAEMIKLDLPLLWLRANGFSNLETLPLAKTLKQARRYLELSGPGFGVERCLYHICPGLPCQSPLIVRDHVTNIEDLLPALDKAASRADGKTKPMDRHLAAFIDAHFSHSIDVHLRALASPKEETAVIGVLSLLAYLQHELNPGPLFGLASWIGGLLGPAINTYHSRSTRRAIEREIPRLVRQGSLPELFDLIDNAEKRKRDREDYDLARQRFAAAEAEVEEIEGKDVATAPETVRKGQKTAAVLSLLLSIFTITMILIISVE